MVWGAPRYMGRSSRRRSKLNSEGYHTESKLPPFDQVRTNPTPSLSRRRYSTDKPIRKPIPLRGIIHSIHRYSFTKILAGFGTNVEHVWKSHRIVSDSKWHRVATHHSTQVARRNQVLSSKRAQGKSVESNLFDDVKSIVIATCNGFFCPSRLPFEDVTQVQKIDEWMDICIRFLPFENNLFFW